MKIISLLLTLVLCVLTLLVSCKPSASPDNSPATPGVHQCQRVCDTCGKCTDSDCGEDVCAEKCGGHVNLPEVDVGDLK